MAEVQKSAVKAIVGLGNPGPKFSKTRHNIGFMVLDALANAYDASWQHKDLMDVATINVAGNPITLIKPQTFMNASGKVFPWLAKKGIKPEEILVVHDELELPFGKTKVRLGGSAKGHNGLRSVIEHIGDKFVRLCCGIGRPLVKEEVPNYVLEHFAESADEVADLVAKAIDALQELF